MLRLLTLLTVLLASLSAVAAQETADLSRLDAIFAQWNKPDSPGCSVGVAKNGKTVAERGYGMANLEYSVPMTPSTISESGSVAKQFVAGSIVLLAQQGKLSLDDNIRKHLPEVPDFGKPITIRHLISHLSGLRDQNEFFALMGLPMGRSVHTNDEILEVVSRQKRLNFDPGTEYLYSNTGYTLLAHIIRRVSGKTLAEFTAENLFRPLGMNNTQWRDDFTRVVKNRATAYTPDGKGGFQMEMPFGHVHGAGGLLTTVGDWLIWNENLDTGRVGGPEFTKQMQTPALFNNGISTGYAMGLTISKYRGIDEVGHGGATAGYRTYLARYPQQKLSVALMCNVTNVNSGNLARQVAGLFLQGMETDADPAWTTSPGFEKLAGLYRNKVTGEVTKVTVKEGRIFLGFGQGTEIKATAPNIFRVPGSGVEYRFTGDGTKFPYTITRRSGQQPLAVYESVPEVKPDAQKLAEYAGVYFSDELLVNHIFAVRDGKLYLRIAPLPEAEVTPLDADGFQLQGGFIKFTRDAKNRITGFDINTGRIRHLRFDRK